MTTSTTFALEEGAAPCEICGSPKYLDAALGHFLCSPCETRAATVGVRGRNDLGDEARVDLHELEGDFFAALRDDIDWQSASDAVDTMSEEQPAATALIDSSVSSSQSSTLSEEQPAATVLIDSSVSSSQRSRLIVEQPRLVAYEAADARPYSYPGLVEPLIPRPFCASLDRLRRLVEKRLGLTDFFNAAHCNLYRNGGDHVSWHTDEDLELYGERPIIASVSYGASRDFVLRSFRKQQLVKFTLDHGSLLVMRGLTQRHFEHSLRKQPHETQPRINVTFRRVLSRPPTEDDLRCLEIMGDV